jgi:cytochrome c-type biogenesis protein
LVKFNKQKQKNINKRLIGIIITLIIAVVIIVSVYWYSLSSGTKRAPDFTLSDINDNEFSLSDFKNKVVVLDFMFTTCSGCIDEMETLKKIYNKYEGQIEIITISIYSFDSNEDIRKFKNDYGGDWIYARDTANLIETYSASMVPKIVIVNKNMDITFSDVGVVSETELSKEIDKAISGIANPVPLGTTLGLAGTAIIVGIGTFFSPCSFPLLPGYMSYYLGFEGSNKIRRALFGGAVTASGIALLFIVIGLVVGLSGYAITPYVIFIEPFIGILIILLGIILLTNYSVPFHIITNPVKKQFLKLQKYISKNQKSEIEKKINQENDFGNSKIESNNERSYYKLFFYGIAYGGAAAGCTAPLIIWLIITAFTTGGFLNAIYIFIISAFVMAILMIFITLLTALSVGNFLQKLKISTVWIKRASGLILIIVGIYLLVYYYPLIIA